jgi:hypothetical protein
MAKEFIAGVAGGLVGAGLMKITAPPPPPPPEASKEVIARQSIGAGSSVTLKPSTNYKFAILLFHGNGDSQVRLDVTVGSTTTSVNGDEQAIELLANESISITAVNTDTTTARYTPTIEILSLSWS